MSTILLQADEVLTKPINLASLRETIHKRLCIREPHAPLTTKSVAAVLETELDATIQDRMTLEKNDRELIGIPLSLQDRTVHLPQLLRDLIYRLQFPTAVKDTI